MTEADTQANETPGESLPPAAPPRQAKKRSRFGRWLFVSLACGTMLGAACAGLMIYWGSLYEDLEVLVDHEPKLFTRVYDRNDKLIDIFSSEKRIVLEYDDIPEDFVHALVAVEDEHFFTHIGVSPLGLISAAKDYVLTGRLRGASTLTQQLVKNITDDRRHSIDRKFKEQLLAVQVEMRFTKEEIFAMYANEVPLGNQQFGIEAAANYYFGKSVGSLSLVECATLAGIPQAPTRYNPYRNLDHCKRRRNWVLDRMAAEQYITAEQAEEAKRLPLEVVDRKSLEQRPLAGHFVAKVRQYLFNKYGEDVVRGSGWNVHTTLDLDAQVAAEQALRKGLEQVDKRQGYRARDCPSVFVGEPPHDEALLESYFDPSWRRPLQDGVTVNGVIMSVSPEQAEVRIGERRFTIDSESVSWVDAARRRNLARLFEVGDVPLFRLVEIGEAAGPEAEEAPEEEEVATEREFRLELEQEPLIEGAFLSVDPSTGDVLAMVGGYDFSKSKFNRAEQAKRQVGSAFKPVVFGAALEQGYTLSDLLFDEPTMFIDPTQFRINERGALEYQRQSRAVERMRRKGLIPMPKPYSPKNYYNDYSGMVTLRQALAESKNIVAVKLLNSVGYDNVMEYVYRLGLGDENLQPFPSLALGAFEMTLADLVQAYAAFDMQGVRFEQRFITEITDKKGLAIEENYPIGRQVISPENAYLVTSAMRAVIEDPRGTARRAQELDLPLAGKTGTTDDWNDAWFLGYHPEVVAGVWVGHDKKIKLWDKATGSNTALPIWMDYFEAMKPKLKARDFEKPEGIVRVPIDKLTGKRMTADCDCDTDTQLLESYLRNTEPIAACTLEEQKEARLPWYLQKRVYEYNRSEGEVKPAMVIVDYRSQLRAKEFIDRTEEKEREEF